MLGSHDRLKDYEVNRLVWDDVFGDISFDGAEWKDGLAKCTKDSAYVELGSL